jgi:hypothetical protein
MTHKTDIAIAQPHILRRVALGMGLLALLLIASVLLTSCKTPDIPDIPDVPDYPTTTTTTSTTTTTLPPAPEPASTNYDLTLTVTSLTEHEVRFEWTPKNYDWPSKTVKKRVDAIVQMYRANGKGGKFDWIRKGGQKSKGLANIYDGYNGHTVPEHGERVTFRWVSIDGKKRSNLAEAIWP